MENFKWSRYNFLWNSEKHGKLLYNSYTNGFLKLDDSLYNDFNAISAKDGVQYNHLFTKDELHYFKNNFIFVENDDSLSGANVSRKYAENL